MITVAHADSSVGSQSGTATTVAVRQVNQTPGTSFISTASYRDHVNPAKWKVDRRPPVISASTASLVMRDAAGTT